MNVKSIVLVSVVLVGVSGVVLMSDLSGDGLRAYEDIQHGTDPLKEDTSGNGLSDYEEVVEYGTDPLKKDTNGDGLSDATNIEYGADPLQEDTNDDGVSDSKAVELGLDPVDTDTNGDGLSDATNIEYGADPLAVDTSENGLSDLKMVELGLDPTVYDSSGDGLPDGYAYDDDFLEVERYNMIVEVQTGSGVQLPEEIFEIEEYLDDVPVYSDAGERGVNVVFLQSDDEVSVGEWIDFAQYRDGVYPYSKTYDGQGVHHLLVVEQFSDESRLGATAEDIDGMVVQDDEWLVDTMLHEMGHQMGLWRYENPCIDSYDCSWDEYPSVMNYNRPGLFVPQPQVTFADSDYTVIENEFENNQADTSVVEEEVAGEFVYE